MPQRYGGFSGRGVTPVLPTCYRPVIVAPFSVFSLYLCDMKGEKSKFSGIFIASLLAVIGLVVFQLSWMQYSRRLSEEIFDQRVCMALCSVVEDYGCGLICSKDGCFASNDTTSPTRVPTPETLVADSVFQADLRQVLDYHHISLPFLLGVSDTKTACQQGHQCAVGVPAATGGQSFITINFPQKDHFLDDKIRFMALATILILLFITIVLLSANWALRKQRRLLQTNVDFFNNMAHEFRTPLTNTGLALNMLVRKNPALHDDRFVEVLRRENKRLLSEVERVLQLAGIHNGHLTLQQEYLPLRELLQSVCQDLELPIAAKGAAIDLEGVPAALEIWGDRAHLANAFRNLIDNALKYNTGQPHIRLSARVQGKGVLVAVEDNGIGIPADQRTLIFEKFQRADQGNIHDQKGFGLGLAYVKSIVELHRGFVCVNTEPRQGSRFEVFLPLTKPL